MNPEQSDVSQFEIKRIPVTGLGSVVPPREFRLEVPIEVQAERAYFGTYGRDEGPTDNPVPQKLWSLADEKDRAASYHLTEAKRAEEAAGFLRAHPEFEVFVGLIRSGAIQF